MTVHSDSLPLLYACLKQSRSTCILPKSYALHSRSNDMSRSGSHKLYIPISCLWSICLTVSYSLQSGSHVSLLQTVKFTLESDANYLHSAEFIILHILDAGLKVLYLQVTPFNESLLHNFETRVQPHEKLGWKGINKHCTVLAVAKMWLARLQRCCRHQILG